MASPYKTMIDPHLEEVLIQKLAVVAEESMADLTQLKHDLKLSTYYHILLRQMVLSLRSCVLAEDLGPESYDVTFPFEYPDGWWQAFKRQYFPAWLLVRFPVRMKTVTGRRMVVLEKYAVYPKLNKVFPKPGPLVLKYMVREDERT